MFLLFVSILKSFPCAASIFVCYIHLSTWFHDHIISACYFKFIWIDSLNPLDPVFKHLQHLFCDYSLNDVYTLLQNSCCSLLHAQTTKNCVFHPLHFHETTCVAFFSRSCSFRFSVFMSLGFEVEHPLQQVQYGWDVRFLNPLEIYTIVVRHIACFCQDFGMIDAKCGYCMSTLFTTFYKKEQLSFGFKTSNWICFRQWSVEWWHVTFVVCIEMTCDTFCLGYKCPQRDVDRLSHVRLLPCIRFRYIP